VTAGWAAAAAILLAPRYAHKVAPYVDARAREIDVDSLLEASAPWSHGEKLMVEVALALFTGRGSWDLGRDEIPLARLGDLVTTLDEGNLRVVLRAVEIYRGWRSPGDVGTPAEAGTR
jgi:hypothetical protein